LRDAEALEHGFIAFGAGGFLGEKRRVDGPEFSLAAKLTKVTYADGAGGTTVGYAAKLGDCSDNGAGSWAEYELYEADATLGLPAKFIVSDEADRTAMWSRMLAYGAKGDAWFDAARAGGPTEHLVPRADGVMLAGALRKLAASTTLAPAPCAKMVERLTRLAERVEAAAAELDA
jgi:hypothetical protein